MANLGQAQSRNFKIGSAELRIGVLGQAGRLTQANSVGLIQSANVNFAAQVTDLKAGLPLQIVDSVVTELTGTVSATIYEYTRRNMRAMLNESLSVSQTDYLFTANLVDSGPAIGTADSVTGMYGLDGDFTIGTGTLSNQITVTNVTVFGGSNPVSGFMGTATNPFAVGSLIGVYKQGYPEDLSIVRVTSSSVTGGSNLVLNFDATQTPLLFDYNTNDALVIYTINPIGIGNSTVTNYYTLDVLGKNHSTGIPYGYRFWKVAIQGGMDDAMGGEGFSTTPMSFKVLLPTASELQDTDPTNGLSQVSSVQTNGNPLGFSWTGQAK